MRNIVFIGAPGSGKGTQSAFITKDFDLVQISTGDILRAAVAAGTDLGKIAQQAMDKGDLVSDDLIIDIMKERLSEPDCKNGFILDGFPRTTAQAVALEEMLHDKFSSKITHVISLEVPDELIYTRITGRRSCPECGKAYHMKFNPPKNDELCDADGTKLIQRSDDTRETLTKRLKVYHETTVLLKPFYADKLDVLIVDGTKNPEEVYKEIKTYLA